MNLRGLLSTFGRGMVSGEIPGRVAESPHETPRSNLSRRHFLTLIGAAGAGAALVPELDLDRLLWVPGQKTIFLPPAVVDASLDGHQFVTVDWITREALKILENNLAFSKRLNRQYDTSFVGPGRDAHIHFSVPLRCS